MATPTNISGKLKNTPVQPDNFVFPELLSSRKSFYVYCGKARKRIYQGTTSQEIQNIYFDGMCVVALCKTRTYVFGPNDIRYPLKSWRKIREY